VLVYSFALTADDYRDLVNADTGFNYTTEELMKVGRTSWNLERLFNLKAGFTKADDTYRNGFWNSLYRRGLTRELCIIWMNCCHLLQGAWLGRERCPYASEIGGARSVAA